MWPLETSGSGQRSVCRGQGWSELPAQKIQRLRSSRPWARGDAWAANNVQIIPDFCTRATGKSMQGTLLLEIHQLSNTNVPQASQVLPLKNFCHGKRQLLLFRFMTATMNPYWSEKECQKHLQICCQQISEYTDLVSVHHLLIALKLLLRVMCIFRNVSSNLWCFQLTFWDSLIQSLLKVKVVLFISSYTQANY